MSKNNSRGQVSNVASLQVASVLERPAAEGSEMVNGHSEDASDEWKEKFEQLTREHEKM